MQTRRILTIILLSVFAGLGASDCDGSERGQAQKFFNNYCVSCHGKDASEGGVQLDQVDLATWNDIGLLEKIYEALENGEMPPDSAFEVPAVKDLVTMNKVLISQLNRLSEQQIPGMLKRLSRVEYQNSVNDVFGSQFSLLDNLPLDNIDEGFNNNADHLHISVVDMEAYFKVANLVASSVVGEKPEPRLVVYSTKNTDIDSLSHKDDTNGYAPTLDREARPLVFATPAKQIKINPSVRSSGVYRVIPKGFYITAEYVSGSREAERLPAVKNIKEQDGSTSAAHSMSYFLRKNAGAGQSIVTVIPANADWKEFDPQVGFTTHLNSDDTIVLRCNSVQQGGRQRMYCVETATISGPVYESWPPKTFFYQSYCDGIDDSADIVECKSILRTIAQRLFRRIVTDKELSQFYSQAEREYEEGRGLYSGLQAGIRGMLCSPNFLYKQEGAVTSLDQHAIAARMSYFLWNSVPDDELFELASQGRLSDPLVRSEQAERMLSDVKAKRFIDDYVYQWLDLEKLENIEPDLSIFSVEEFDLVRAQIRREPAAFFTEVLKSNLSLKNFIDSEFVMLTPELNYIYRIAGHPIANPQARPDSTKVAVANYKPREITSEFSKVVLTEKDRLRGGLLTQAGFMLMTTNNGEYTNPFYRGAWVLKSFYGDPLETPADLEIAALSPPTKTTTIKETIDAHRENASCNSCHSKMDPLGIALENFDVLGRWRDSYTEVAGYTSSEGTGSGKPESFAVVSKTVHRDGRAFEGPQGLKKLLLDDSDKFSRVFLRNMLSYAMARQLTFRDREFVEELDAQAIESEYRLRDLLIMIVASEHFTNR